MANTINGYPTIATHSLNLWPKIKQQLKWSGLILPDIEQLPVDVAMMRADILQAALSDSPHKRKGYGIVGYCCRTDNSWLLLFNKQHLSQETVIHECAHLGYEITKTLKKVAGWKGREAEEFRAHVTGYVSADILKWIKKKKWAMRRFAN